ncbi:IS1 transposase (plasmid) [Chondrocystis sp. NIES-4102]|nr:IS1 transposase [Chondrocystis sp. NIES-4102]
MVNHWQPGILLWTVGDRSSETFKRLWLTIKCWQSFWYVSDGYPVYPCFIQPEDHLVSKTYMTRVEGENTRLRHYLARLPSWARASIERLYVTQNQLKCSNIQFVCYSTI